MNRRKRQKTHHDLRREDTLITKKSQQSSKRLECSENEVFHILKLKCECRKFFKNSTKYF